jgi:hypothetical protein
LGLAPSTWIERETVSFAPALGGHVPSLAAAASQDRRPYPGRLGPGSIDAMTRADLLEIVDDRAGQRATIIT